MNDTLSNDASKTSENKPSALAPFIDTIKGSREFVATIADASLTAVKETNALEHIPIISWAVKAYAVSEKFHQALLNRNVKAFLESVQGMDSEKIHSLSQKLSGDPLFAEEFLDALMFILLEAEKPEKAAILGRLVASLASSSLTSREYEDLSLMVLSASVPALRALPAYYAETEGKGYTHTARVRFEALLMSLGVGRRMGNLFEVDENGKKLFVYGMDGSVQD